MMKTKKQNIKGITLISLVITVIILLILAAVAINLAIDSEGLFGHANTAAKKWNDSVAKEEDDINDLLDVLEIMTAITSENYGDYVAYPVDLGIDGDFDGEVGDYTDDWRIFYKNDEYVFIIAADVIPDNLLPENDWPATISTKTGMADVTEQIATKYKLSWWTENQTDTSKRAKPVASLLDTNNWSYFATGCTGAEATGSPTLEMFIASWNATKNTPLFSSYVERGYCVGFDVDNLAPDVNYVRLGSSYTGDGSLYFASSPFWLASPAANNGSQTMNSGLWKVDSMGGNPCLMALPAMEGTSNFDRRLRPLVAIPKDVFDAKDEDGVWRLK